MSYLSKSDYDYINLAGCIRGQADWLGIDTEGVPLEGVVVRIANSTPPAAREQDTREPSDAEVEAALDALSRFNQWTENPRGAIRAALLAAQEVRHADNS